MSECDFWKMRETVFDIPDPPPLGDAWIDSDDDSSELTVRSYFLRATFFIALAYIVCMVICCFRIIKMVQYKFVAHHTRTKYSSFFAFRARTFCTCLEECLFILFSPFFLSPFSPPFFSCSFCMFVCS